MAFLRNLLATLVGLFIFSFLGFAIFIGIFAGIAASGDDVPEVKENSVLRINLSGTLLERAKEEPLAELLEKRPSSLGLIEIKNAIKAAATDDKIKGIYLRPMYLQAGQASMLELRNTLEDFKSSGKFIYAYGEYVSEGDFLVASVADSLFLNPEGSLEFNGMSASITFFKGLFDKLGVEPEIFRVGKYKSFIEPFTRTSMSDENREQMSALIGSVYDNYITNVAQSLGMDEGELMNISNQMLVQNPQLAEEYNLVSKVAYQDEATAALKRALEIEGDTKIKFVDVTDYAKTIEEEYASDKIAVIVASGEIVMGGDEETIDGHTFAKEIKKARENDAVKAIVLRVNSPGGSLTASDIIWREIMLTKGVKPIIASMSDVAASGGYFISAHCDTIVAQPNTITGSIGIFGMMFNFGDFMEQKLGITTDNVKTGEYSDILTVTRSLTPAERAIIQKQIDKGYDTFISRVADGRGMTKEAVMEVAGGRVWSGTQAEERGLVDLLGSLDDAIEIAAQKAGLSSDYRLVYYPEQKEWIEQFFNSVDDLEASYAKSQLGILAPYVDQVKHLEQMQGIQARLAGDIIIE